MVGELTTRRWCYISVIKTIIMKVTPVGWRNVKITLHTYKLPIIVIHFLIIIQQCSFLSQFQADVKLLVFQVSNETNDEQGC